MTELEHTTIKDIRARYAERARGDEGFSEAQCDIGLLLGILDQQARERGRQERVFFGPPEQKQGQP